MYSCEKLFVLKTQCVTHAALIHLKRNGYTPMGDNSIMKYLSYYIGAYFHRKEFAPTWNIFSPIRFIICYCSNRIGLQVLTLSQQSFP